MHIEWPQIIREIQRLHRQGEPLNISAVKRNHPELIRAVYAVKPFKGWKRALEDAGLEYAKIKVELQDTVQCELCGKFFLNLGSHLMRKHEVRSDDYLIDYPESELMSETLRAAKMIRKNRFLSHWEPAWSREYILDRLAEYRRQGFSMNYTKLENVDPQLAGTAHRYLDDWNWWPRSMITIGLDPRKLTRESYRLSRRYPDKAAVIQAIKQRLKKGWRVIPYAFLKGARRDATLLNNGMEYFGSWSKALQAAGLDLEKALQRERIRKYRTKDDIIAAIRDRHKRKLPLSLSEILLGRNRDCMLGVYANEYFGPWSKALKAAGIDPADVYDPIRSRRTKYPDAKSLLRAIKRRVEERRSLNYMGVGFSRDRDFPLIGGAKRLFGSWNNALKKAGLDPNQIKHDVRSRAARERHRQRKLRQSLRRPNRQEE